MLCGSLLFRRPKMAINTPTVTIPQPRRVSHGRCSSKINQPIITVIGAWNVKTIDVRLGPNLCRAAKSAVSPRKIPMSPEIINV